MKNDIEQMQRLLEKATDAGSAPPDELDPETASLREAWLAFGQMLEAAPAACLAAAFAGEAEGKEQIVGVLAAGLLAASLLIGVVAVWMLHGASRQADPTPTTNEMASTNPIKNVAPATQANSPTVAKADEPQWDDSLDERLSQIGWQVTCAQQNQLFRTDTFGVVQYRVEQLRQAIQADSL